MRSSTHGPDNRTFSGRQSFAYFSTVAARHTKLTLWSDSKTSPLLSSRMQECWHTFGQGDIIHDLDTQLNLII